MSKITRIHADVVSSMRGVVRRRPVALTINADRTELDFLPAREDWPAQARVHVRVWNRGSRRFDYHTELVAVDSIKVVEEVAQA